VSTSDELVAEYLERLRGALAAAGCPQSRGVEIVDEVSAHIREARASMAGDDEAAVRELLDRIGSPDEIAAEAPGRDVAALPVAQLADAEASSSVAGGRRRRRPRRWHLEALAALVALAIIAGLSLSLASGTPGLGIGFASQACAVAPGGQKIFPPVPVPAPGQGTNGGVLFPSQRRIHFQFRGPDGISRGIVIQGGGPPLVCTSVHVRQALRSIQGFAH
jgi:hypothetical protein